MKILLVVPRYSLASEVNYDYAFPLGLAYISSVMKKAGHIVDCINLNHLEGKTKDILEKKLDTKQYDIVATGNNALGYKITEVIMNTAKNHNSNPVTILGGPIITSEPDLIYNSLNPDFGVLGEGEETIVELLEYIRKSKDPKNVKGIIYKDKSNNLVVTEKRSNIKDLDSIPLPDFEGIGFQEQVGEIHTNYNYQAAIFDYPRIYPLLGSRSCPFQCTFCYHDSRYRRRSILNIMAELREMTKKYQINIISIYDECFAIDKKRLVEFCEEIKSLQKEIPWELKWSCQLRVDSIDGETLKVLKDSGCFAISYGFESCSPEVLKSMRKNIIPEQIHKAFYDTMEAKIGVQANFIFGDVAETKETAEVTLNYFKNYGKGQIGLTFIQPYPGSEIYGHCIRKGIIKDKLEFIKNEIIPGRGLWLNMTENMSDKEILKLKKEIFDAQGQYVEYVVPKKMEKTGKDIYKVEVYCPFCNKKVIYGHYLAKNKIYFGSFLICRECFMRFYIVSPIQKLGYRFYKYTNYIRPLMDFLKKTSNSISKAKL